MNHRGIIIAVILLLAGMLAKPINAANSPTASTQPLAGNQAAPTLQDLQREIQTLQAQVARIRNRRNRTWMDAHRQAEVKRIIDGVLLDASRQSRLFTQVVNAGYDRGFFIRSPHNEFLLKIRGYIQAGYIDGYSHASHAQNIDLNGLPAGPPTVGNASKFNLRRARLIFSGHIFNPKVLYEISGDFAGSSNPNGYFQLKTTYGGYRWSHGVILRAGILRVPFTYLSDYPVTGDDFGSFPLVSIPFNAERSTGLDLSGRLNAQHFSYDAQINNGSKSSNAGSAIDNRLGCYLRLQWSGSSRISRFRNEGNLHSRDHLAWMAGLGLGYESQNSTPDAFPSPQTTLTLPGLATPDGAGFYPSIPVNGSLYRATTDAHIKYLGFDASGTVYFQEYNDRPPAGSSTDNFVAAFGRRSLFEMACYGEVGYFFVPGRWQIIGRTGELLTESGNRQMLEYGLGLNDYLYGRNARIQTSFIYVPNAAALSSSSTATVINAQNLIFMTQFQLKF